MLFHNTCNAAGVSKSRSLGRFHLDGLFHAHHVTMLSSALRHGFSAGCHALLVGLALSSFAYSAVVNKAPKSYLLGPGTSISTPSGVALDSQGNRYVSNLGTDSVTVYAPDASGNSAPIRTIQGSNTQLVGPRSITVDADGRIYVGDLFGAGSDKVAVFAPGADGNVAPERVITGDNTMISWAQGLAVDSTGRLYVANRNTSTIAVFAPGSDGNITPLRLINGPATGLDEPMNIALTAGNILHVVNSGSSSITSYASGAAGDASPTRTISGANTGLAALSGLAADSLGNLYVISSFGEISVSVFGPTASGNVAPHTRLTGAETDLNTAYGLAITENRDLVVPSYFGDALLTYSPFVPVPTPPTVVRLLSVSGKADSAKRTVSWGKPKSDNGAPITGYQVSVTSKGKTIFKKKLPAGQLKLAIRKSSLRAGKNLITVQARNSYGLSPKKSVVVTVATGGSQFASGF